MKKIYIGLILKSGRQYYFEVTGTDSVDCGCKFV